MGALMGGAVCPITSLPTKLLLRDDYPTALLVIVFVCLLVWAWWLYSTEFSVGIIRSCCGRNADGKLSGYNSLLPDAEIIPEAKDRDNTVTVYTARDIVTMDPTWPNAKVVACQYGRILGIGESLQDLYPWLTRKGLDPENDVIIDRTFEEEVIVPGFIEQHGHPMIGGTAMSLIPVAYHDLIQPYEPKIKGCNNKQEVIDRLKKEHKRLPLTDGLAQAEMIMAWGYDWVVMGSHLTRGDLDEIDPEGKRCVFVWDCSMHFIYVNTATLEKKMKMDVKHGKKYKKVDGVETDPLTGELTGAFLGIPAIDTYCQCLILPLIKPSRSLESMHTIAEVARMNGITTMCEMLLGALNVGFEVELYKWFFENEITPIRCLCIFDADKVKKSMSPFRLPLPNARANAAARWIRDRQLHSSEKLMFNNGVKFFADDSMLGLTIQLTFPGYVEPQRRRGIWNTAPGSSFASKILPFWKAGCRIHVHSNGEASQDAVSEVVQILQTIHPRFDHRFCLEHYGMSASHIHRKLKNLGVNVSVNVYYALLRGQINEAHIGKDKAHAASRLKSIVDSGLVVAMHADTPVAPPRPLEEMWFACNRVADKLTTLPSSESTSKPSSKPINESRLIEDCSALTDKFTELTDELSESESGLDEDSEFNSENTNCHSQTSPNATSGDSVSDIQRNMKNSTIVDYTKLNPKLGSRLMDGHSELNRKTKNSKTGSKLINGNGATNDRTILRGNEDTTTKKEKITLCPSERITPYEAMRMKTIDAAYVQGLDGVIGSIEAGKLADFTILAENPLECDKATLKDIQVIATVIGGVKRMNVPQKRRVPVPPGDHFVGQVFWMKAMNITETGILPGVRRWLFLKIAAYYGSTGTLEEAQRIAKEKSASKITKYNKRTKTFDLYSVDGNPECRPCAPVCEEEEEILSPIKSKHVKPPSSMSNSSCC